MPGRKPEFRQHRDREPGEHGGGDRAGVRARVEHAEGAADRFQPFDGDAPPRAGRPPERQRQAFFEMRRMPVRRHPQQPLAPERFRGALAFAIGDDGEIDLVGVDALEQIDRRLADHDQLDRRIGAREARHDLGQIAVGIVVRHAEPHAAGQFGVGKRRQRLDVELDDAARVIEQALAVFGELRGAPVAREDRPLEPLLQPLHLHRDRGLGLVHDLGRLGEAAGLGDGDEGAQLVDVEQRGHGRVGS